jgi:hypothetical protein
MTKFSLTGETIDWGGFQITKRSAIPADLSLEAVRKAVEIITEWEANHESPVQLAIDLYPVLTGKS